MFLLRKVPELDDRQWMISFSNALYKWFEFEDSHLYPGSRNLMQCLVDNGLLDVSDLIERLDL